MEPKTTTFDATGQKLGRLATQIAMELAGKNSPHYIKNEVPNVKVVVTNASKLSINAKKMTEKEYERYSGYPGGFAVDSLEKLIAKKGYGEAIKLAVYGMLPINKLRSKIIQNLTTTE